MIHDPKLFRLLPALALCFFVLPGTPASAATQQEPTYETTEIAEGVYRFRWQAHVGMFVIGEEGVAAFDPINPEAAADFASEIRRVAGDRPLRWIVYSHSDLDHSTGADVLIDALGGAVPIVANEAAVDDIVAHDDPAQPLPTVTFDRYMSLELGDRVVELHFFGPSHTDNNLVAYVPDVQVAWAVDFVSDDRVGYRTLPGWHFPEQNETIRAMLALPFETVIYGHGPVGDRASVWRQARYYDTLEMAVRAAIAEGLTEDETVARVQLTEFDDFEAYDEWLELNVRGTYRILSGG